MLKPGGQRVVLIDALRALAILGVVVVNSASFSQTAAGPIAGTVQPQESVLAALIHGLIVALFQNKAYPLLAFLVGYTMALQMRGATATMLRHRRRVAWTMIALGLAHGFLIYFGDILLAYGLMMLILVRLHRVRLKRLLRLCAALAVFVALTALSFSVMPEGQVAHSIGDALTWQDVIRTNAQIFGLSLLAMPVTLLPVVLVFGVLGLVAGRLRYLHDARRWGQQWQCIARVALPLGLLLNIGNGMFCAINGARGQYYDFAEFTMPTLVGPILSAGVVTWIAPRFYAGSLPWLHSIAPAGRYTLSMYLATSLTLVATMPQAGLGWAQDMGTVDLFVFALTLCAVWFGVALWLAQRRITGPAERLLRS